MKKRYLEFVALLSLIVYVALVAAGQALHTIPGCACHCYRNSTETLNDIASPGKSSLMANYGHENAIAKSLNDCLVCQWLFMAQHPNIEVTLSFKSMANQQLARPPFCGRRLLSFGQFLPRGPPLALGS